MLRVLSGLVLLLACSAGAYAQVGVPDYMTNFSSVHVFPQFADGVLSDGSSYRSTLMIQSIMASTSATCNLTMQGMTTTIGSVSGFSFSVAVSAAAGWTVMRTNGTQPFQSGYATLTCSFPVFAQILYSFYVGGAKVSEATVFSADPAISTVRLIADQTESARLGIAIANDTDTSRTYSIKLVNSAGATVATTNVTLPARRSLARFLDDLIPSSANSALEAQIKMTDPPTTQFPRIYVIGLRFTGVAFTTIPAHPASGLQ